MIFDVENSLWKSKIGTFWQTVTRWRLKIWEFHLTTVDSWPKTLPMLSARSWNSTTETHLLNIPNFWPTDTVRTVNDVLEDIHHYRSALYIVHLKTFLRAYWLHMWNKKCSYSCEKNIFDHFCQKNFVFGNTFFVQTTKKKWKWCMLGM